MFFVKDKRKGYRQVTADELKKMLKSAHENIATATHYTGDLYHGTCGDSSDASPFRMAYVEQAQADFIKEHQKNILQRAADMVLRDIHALEADTANSAEGGRG